MDKKENIGDLLRSQDNTRPVANYLSLLIFMDEKEISVEDMRKVIHIFNVIHN